MGVASGALLLALCLYAAALALAGALLVRRHAGRLAALPRRLRLALALVVAAGAALRLANVEASAIVYSDEYEALLSSRSMLLSHALGYPLNLRWMPPAHRPGMAALAAVPLSLLGAGDRAAAVASAALGSIAVPLTFALALLLFGDAWGALAAATLLALHPEHLQYSVTGWSASPSHALALASLVLAAYASRHGRRAAWAAASGAGMGLATMVRSADTVLVPVAALYLWREAGARRAALFALVALAPSALLAAALPAEGGAQGALPCPWAEGACTELSLARVLGGETEVGVRGVLPAFLLNVFAGVRHWSEAPGEGSSDPVVRLLGNQWGDLDPLVLCASALAALSLASSPRPGHALVLGSMLVLLSATSLFNTNPRHALTAACLLPVLAGDGLGSLSRRLPGGGKSAAAILALMLLRFHTQGTALMLRLHRGDLQGEPASELLFQSARIGRWLAESGAARGCAVASAVPLATAFYAGGPGVDVRALARSPELQGSLAEAARRGCALFLDTCADWVPDTDVGRVRSSFALEAVASAGRCGSWHGEGGEVVLYRMRPRS